MKHSTKLVGVTAGLALTAGALTAMATATDEPVFEAGHDSLQAWLLPDTPPYPKDNAPTAERIELGKKLFFDPRLSGDGNMSCASCHNPAIGWSDGLPTARGTRSMVLGRATPTIVNTAFNSIQMWDGRKATLEDQAMGPMEATVEMNMDTGRLFEWLRGNAEYRELFETAYPGEEVGASTVSRAIANFERTVISNNSPFDRWAKGDAAAMTEQQVQGFQVFTGKGRCAACHMGGNFTDDGFHNLGLASFGVTEPDMGRYAQKPIGLMKGAFKTPTLRDVARTAPYFHDGSSQTLRDVVDHYAGGGVVTSNLSPSMKPLDLTETEKEALVAFLEALTSPYEAVALPELPRN